MRKKVFSSHFILIETRIIPYGLVYFKNALNVYPQQVYCQQDKEYLLSWRKKTCKREKWPCLLFTLYTIVQCVNMQVERFFSLRILHLYRSSLKMISIEYYLEAGKSPKIFLRNVELKPTFERRVSITYMITTRRKSWCIIKKQLYVIWFQNTVSTHS